MSLNLLNCHTRASARPALFLDIEGDADAASYYLIGVLTVANGKATQKSFWAKHCDEEEIIWRRFLRGGLGNQDTAISGNSAPTDRARCPGKQKDHEQKTAPKSLVDLQGQGGLGRHSRREDVGRIGQGA